MILNKWSGVRITMQSALAAADTVSAITKASPGVATSTAHGMANGAYYLLKATGMYEVDERVFRVANTAANAFDLEGENTTLYGTFEAGTAEEITFGTSIATAIDISGEGGDFAFDDDTLIHDTIMKESPGLASAVRFSMTHRWDVSDTGLLALNVVSKTKARRAFKFVFATGQIMVFSGYVGATLIPGGSAKEKVTTKVVITASGLPTYYAA